MDSFSIHRGSTNVTGYEKRDHITEFSLESIVATAFNFGVTILTSFCSTCKEFHASPTSSLGGQVRESIVFENCHLMPHFGSSPFGTRGLL